MSGITLTTEGRRTYLIGNTYPLRDRLRTMGAHWDAARKAWWTAKREEAAALIASAPDPAPRDPRIPRDGRDSIVAGRGLYKGKSYYLAGRRLHGGDPSGYDDVVRPVTTTDRSKILLYFRDGSSQFWAAADQVTIQKSYAGPQTIRGLHEYAAEIKRAEANGEPTCWACRKYCTCSRGGFCSHHHDGCDVCGVEG